MFCKRVAAMTKNAKAQPDEIREQQRAITERLISNYRDVLDALDLDSETTGDVLATARRTINAAGGFADELADIDAVSAHHATTTNCSSSGSICDRADPKAGGMPVHRRPTQDRPHS